MTVFKSFNLINNVGKVELLSADTENEILGTAKYGETLEIKVNINRQLICTRVAVLLLDDSDGTVQRFSTVYDSFHRCFRVRIDTKELCHGTDNGLFFFAAELQTHYGKLYLCRYDTEYFLEQNLGCAFCYQLTVYAEDYTIPQELQGGIMYQIMVDRFFIGRKRIQRDDTINIKNWYEPISQYPKTPGDAVKNDYFYGGNLYGVAEKLDYLKSLGVNCIYLCPIFEAFSNHKYDTGNYMKVDESFGGDEALKFLIDSADEKGISIILDGVFNHTGADSIYFNKNGRYDSVGACQSKKSPYYNWYTFEEFPNIYACWWGVKILPSVNTENPDYIDFICGNGGVVDKYMSIGIKGLRLDVVDELSDKFLQALYTRIKSKDKNALLFGEVWEDASNKIAYGKRRKYFRGNQLDSVMNYPLRNAILRYLTEKDSRFIAATCRVLWYNYPRFVCHNLMNFLGTHDTERIITLLSGVDVSKMTNDELAAFTLSENERKRAAKLLKTAYVLLMTLPGIACIYYGDEIGVEGGRDPFNRTAYPWGREDTKILAWCKKLSNIRHSHEVFKYGDFKIIEERRGIFAFVRSYGQEKCIVCSNFNSEPYDLFIGLSVKDAITDKRFEDFVTVPSEQSVILFTEKRKIH